MKNLEHRSKDTIPDPRKLILFSKSDVIGILRTLNSEVRNLKPSYKDEYGVSRGSVIALIEDVIGELDEPLS